MDHTFSTSPAIRQHHQHQSIRNSLSPSPHSNATTTHHHIYRISPTPITNNILSAAAAISVGNYSHYGKSSPITAAGTNLGSSSTGYPTSPQQTAVINPANVSSYYRVPTQQQPQVQVHQQHHHQQQQYLQQIQQQQSPQQSCNFASVAPVATSPQQQEASYPTQGGIHPRISPGQYPLRPNNTTNNSSSIRISPTNQPLSVTAYSAVSNGPSYSPQLAENKYRNQHHHSHHQQSHQQPQYQQQFSNVTGNQKQQQHHQYQNQIKSQQHNHSHSSQQQHQHMSNNQHQHHHQQQQQPSHSNMNKNRYVNQQSSNINGVVGVGAPQSSGSSSGGVAENGNNSTAASVKALIQQVSQHQQNVNNNVNACPPPTTTVAPSSNGANQNSPAVAPQAQQPPQQPQYRIFKRGDSIPGITSPVQLTPPTPPVSVTSSETGASAAREEGNAAGGSPVETQNDKENNQLSPTNGGNSGASSTGNLKTPLSQIGEIARYHQAAVEYRLVNETGPPHAPTFTVLLKVGPEEFNGEGSSIKKAQHAAAVLALEKTTLTRPPPKNKPLRKSFGAGGGGGGGGNAGQNKRPNWNLVQLTALVQELQLPLQFVQQPVAIVDPFRRGDPPSIVSVHVGDKVFTGEGSNFNSAKNTAVMIALKAMIKVKQEVDLAKMVQAGADAEQNMMDADNKSPISIVHEMAMKRGLTVQFEILKEEGPPHMKVFTVKCKVGELDTEGEGPTKQAAKKTSSELMIAKLKEIPITVPATSQGINLKAMQRGFLRQKQQKKKTSTPVVKDLEKQMVSPISRLIQIAHAKKFKEPEFTLISTGTESNVETFLKQITERDRRILRKKKPIFTIEVSVGSHTCQGQGSNKKAAKKAAAEAAVIALGYEPTEGAFDEGSGTSGGDDNASPDQSCASPPATTITTAKTSGKKGGARGEQGEGGKSSGGTTTTGGGPTVKLAGARQIAPGIIVLKSENSSGGGTTSSAVAQEMKKVGSLMTPSPSASSREGIDKLAYLSKLLEISVSYSDFPKKNEYLSVVSLTTNPPHVAHGCGKSLEEAQNAAALKILEELSTMDLDSVTAAAEKTAE